MSRETWIGIAWAAGLFLAMAAVFVYEAQTFELDKFDVTWETTDTYDNKTATLAVGATQDYTFNFTTQNVTAVHFILQWTDGNGGDDTFKVDVAGPGGINHTATGSTNTGEIALHMTKDMFVIPNQTSVRGIDRADAMGKLQTADAWANGEWKVTVTMVSAPPQATPVAGPVDSPAGCGTNPGQSACDTGNAFTLTAYGTTFRAIVEE